MRFISFLLISAFCLTLLPSLTNPSTGSIGFNRMIEYFKVQSLNFASSAADLKSAISLINSKKPQTVVNARYALKKSRIAYKKIEFFMEYFFKSNAVVYNGPPKFEIEEPYMEYQTPIGLQVIESLLFKKDVFAGKNELIEQADALASSSMDLPSLLYGFTANDKQVLESVRLQLVRIYTLGISGYDAPLLKSGIGESIAALEAIAYSLKPFLALKSAHADSVSHYLESSMYFLRSNEDFDSFDRLAFLRFHALPLQQHIGLLIKEMDLEQNTTGNILNYTAINLFSADAINLNAFPSAKVDVTLALIKLGKKLFNETALSGNNQMSCATCHQAQKHFTDAIPKSIAFNGHSTLTRNAPTLLYAAFQYDQFWDGRAKSLEEQVMNVLSNAVEMNCNPAVSIKRIQHDDKYALLFSTAFPAEKSDTIVTIQKIAAAIAAFERTLVPRNSPFDKYMMGNNKAITWGQKRGFNLFMGKAQCGTCHFAPLFNGLIPPLYALTELEVLGTTKTDNFNETTLDADKGRYKVFPIEFYKGAFKTPTVRNASATAPYMHNGSFKTLQKVVEFYNKGGGKGVGVKIENQTLSSSPLNLSQAEIHDIVGFINSLKDSLSF